MFVLCRWGVCACVLWLCVRPLQVRVVRKVADAARLHTEAVAFTRNARASSHVHVDDAAAAADAVADARRDAMAEVLRTTGVAAGTDPPGDADDMLVAVPTGDHDVDVVVRVPLDELSDDKVLALPLDFDVDSGKSDDDEDHREADAAAKAAAAAVVDAVDADNDMEGDDDEAGDVGLDDDGGGDNDVDDGEQGDDEADGDGDGDNDGNGDGDVDVAGDVAGPNAAQALALATLKPQSKTMLPAEPHAKAPSRSAKVVYPASSAHPGVRTCGCANKGPHRSACAMNSNNADAPAPTASQIEGMTAARARALAPIPAGCSERTVYEALGAKLGAAGDSGDTLVTTTSFLSALISAGLACEAVDRVMLGRAAPPRPGTDSDKPLSPTDAILVAAGRLQGAHNAFVFARPPGHHAGRQGHTPGAPSCGFCLLNNVCVAAAHAKTRYPDTIRRVAVVDLVRVSMVAVFRVAVVACSPRVLCVLRVVHGCFLFGAGRSPWQRHGSHRQFFGLFVFWFRAHEVGHGGRHRMRRVLPGPRHGWRGRVVPHRQCDGWGEPKESSGCCRRRCRRHSRGCRRGDRRHCCGSRGGS